MDNDTNRSYGESEHEDSSKSTRRTSILSRQSSETGDRKNRQAKKVVFREVDYTTIDEKKEGAERKVSLRRNSLAPRTGSTDSHMLYPILSPVTRAPSIVRRQGLLLSRTIAKASIEKPWLEAKAREREWGTIIPLIGILLGFIFAGGLIYIGVAAVQNHAYCPVLIENFDSPTLNASVWTQEVQSGGFGNGEFEVTTNTDENVYIQDGALVIKPTLQNNTLLTAPYAVVNLTSEGICTSKALSDCVTVTDSTNGTIINPVKSGRINTKLGANIKYGRVEVMAKLPIGDWLWPAIWMLPVNDIYGPWPASGEIDIMESRGNNYTYAQGGNNIISSTLHWGPIQALDQYWRTYTKNRVQHTTFANSFHTFGLEWSEKYLFTYADSRLQQVLYTPFNGLPWSRGRIPSYSGTHPVSDPWSFTGRDSTPFDTEFYLILNVAVGGTNGYFADGASNKPWFDASTNASSYFWNAKDQWYPSWTEGEAQMTVKSVKMWQQCSA